MYTLSYIVITTDQHFSVTFLNAFLIIPTNCTMFIHYIHYCISPSCFVVMFTIIRENFGALYLKPYVVMWSGIESRWGRDFPPVQTGPGAHPASCKMGTGSFPGVKCGRGVLLTTHPLLVPRSWKRRAIPLPTLWATPGL